MLKFFIVSLFCTITFAESIASFPKDFKTWLYSDSIKELNSLFKIYPSENLELYEVSPEVNKVTFDESTCIKRVEKIQIGQQSLF